MTAIQRKKRALRYGCAFQAFAVSSLFAKGHAFLAPANPVAFNLMALKMTTIDPVGRAHPRQKDA